MGPWAWAHGHGPMGQGPWARAHGPGPMGQGPWAKAHGPAPKSSLQGPGPGPGPSRRKKFRKIDFLGKLGPQEKGHFGQFLSKCPNVIFFLKKEIRLNRLRSKFPAKPASESPVKDFAKRIRPTG